MDVCITKAEVYDPAAEVASGFIKPPTLEPSSKQFPLFVPHAGAQREGPAGWDAVIFPGRRLYFTLHSSWEFHSAGQLFLFVYGYKALNLNRPIVTFLLQENTFF